MGEAPEVAPLHTSNLTSTPWADRARPGRARSRIRTREIMASTILRGRGLRRLVGAAPRGLLRAGPDRGHADLPAVRRGDGGRAGAVPRLRGRVPARRASRLQAAGRGRGLRRDVRGADGGRRRRRRPAGRRPDDLLVGAALRRRLSAAARLGRPQPLRPLAGAADGRGAGRLPRRRGPGSAWARSALRRRRRSTRPCWRRSSSPTSGRPAAGARRSSAAVRSSP